ncbi:MAG: protein phosphatase 2C domain-containing protein [Ardenticatenaceae bacterium]
MSKSADNRSLFVIGNSSICGRGHEENEDSRDVFTTTVQPENDRSLEVPATVVVVADGIGGAVGGKEASRIAVETIKEAIGGGFLRPPISLRLGQAIVQANQAIHRRVSQNPQLKNMGSTVVVAIITHNRLYVSHAGDSRAYLIRQDQVRQLTVDHTWVQEAIAAGRLTPQEAAQHPNRSVVKRYLGTDEKLEVDHRIIDLAGRKEANGQPQTTPSLELRPGDVVMLCTDGLSDLVTEQEMVGVIKKHKNAPQEAVDELIKMANAKGATDDITVVAVALREERKSRVASLLTLRGQREASTGFRGQEKLNSGIVGAPKAQTEANPEAVVQNRAIAVLLGVILSLFIAGVVLWMSGAISNTPGSQSAVTNFTPSASATAQNIAATIRIISAESSALLATNTASPEPSAPPSTSTPTRTIATATPTFEQSTSTPVPTFTPIATSTPLASPTPILNTPAGLVTLLEPAHQATVKALPVRFRVQVSGKLESDVLELRVWISINDQKTVTRQWRVVEADTYETEVERLPEGFGVGQNYFWTVVLIGADRKVRDNTAPPRQIQWNEPTQSLPNAPITLLEPAPQSSTQNSPLQLKIKIVNIQSTDTLTLWIGSTPSHLEPIEVEWYPAAKLDQLDEFVAKLPNPPKGYGKPYYWTVTLLDKQKNPLPYPDAIEFEWEEP